MLAKLNSKRCLDGRLYFTSQVDRGGYFRSIGVILNCAFDSQVTNLRCNIPGHKMKKAKTIMAKIKIDMHVCEGSSELFTLLCRRFFWTIGATTTTNEVNAAFEKLERVMSPQ